MSQTFRNFILSAGRVLNDRALDNDVTFTALAFIYSTTLTTTTTITGTTTG